MRVRILGAGIIGLSCAEELLRRGHDVVVVDPAPGSGASFAAAGMLSPSSELWHGEEEILRLGLASVELWDEYAARLGVRLHRTGTLLAGLDRADLQQVERQVELLGRLGSAPKLLTGRAARAIEPTLSGRVSGGAVLADDHSVDPREVIAALLERVPVGALVGSAVGSAPRDHELDALVVATGSRLPEPWADLVRGVRGEILRARTEDPPRQTVRAWVHGQPVYVVPRGDGRIVIGATSEEHDAAPAVTLGGMARLLEAARLLLPGLERATFEEATARDRPGTPDNLPLVGPAPGSGPSARAAGGPRVVLAAGLFRHGVLLAPLVARLVADHLETGCVDPALDPRRFAEAGQHSTDTKERR